jgi:solute carrier family 25 aspartate/glutamate transporter 12/13
LRIGSAERLRYKINRLANMPNVIKAKEVVKETLLGTDAQEDVQLSAQSKATFGTHAQKDPESGELFMSEEEFINAIAPDGEDYVRSPDIR